MVQVIRAFGPTFVLGDTKARLNSIGDHRACTGYADRHCCKSGYKQDHCQQDGYNSFRLFHNILPFFISLCLCYMLCIVTY